ncbi:MAG: HAMP domain-containing sensor histidine kinase [Gammaproteobacteria bacterium]|nr:HAMP domain-containing sensor histidine kinase [Gammaproteobacteria bacterium]
MKNSLAMLLGSISEITNHCNPQSCPMYDTFNRMQHEAQRVNRDLILLLTLYKMDKGQYFFNIDEVNMNEFLEEVIIDYKDLLQNYNIKISLECDPDLVGYLDRNLVSSIIKTIISNAYQYTTDSIVINVTSDDGYTKISVIDNGCGYPEQMLIDGTPDSNTVNFETGSTGLGLYFSSRVANLHKSKTRKGYIRISNKTNPQGGCFSIYLP